MRCIHWGRMPLASDAVAIIHSISPVAGSTPSVGRPAATGLKGIAIQDGHVRCEQEVAGGRDVYVVPLPAVVTVKEGLNLPRYPSVPGRLRAKRKPVASVVQERPAARLEKLRVKLPPGQGKQARAPIG